MENGLLGILFALLYLLLALYAVYTVIAIWKGAAFVPTSRANVKRILALARPQPGEVLLDLGSGDGRILRAAAKTGAVCRGIEINPLLYLWSRSINRIHGLQSITIKRHDLWDTDLSGVDILVVYFVPYKMEALAKKIRREMKVGARVVSSRYTFSNWSHAESDGTVYLYRVDSQMSVITLD